DDGDQDETDLSAVRSAVGQRGWYGFGGDAARFGLGHTETHARGTNSQPELGRSRASPGADPPTTRPSGRGAVGQLIVHARLAPGNELSCGARWETQARLFFPRQGCLCRGQAPNQARRRSEG